jgi:hypothetical protein
MRPIVRAMRMIWRFLLPLAPWFAFGADPALILPDWLNATPEARDVARTATDAEVDLAFVVSLAPAAVISHYQQQALKAGVQFQTNFDGIGETISASTEGISCIVRVAEVDNGSRVRTSCARRMKAPPRSEALPASWAAPVAADPSVLSPIQTTRPQPAPPLSLAEAKSDLEAIESEITAAQKTDAQYSGGLTKALSTARIATLRQTQAILEQRLLSIKAGASVHALSPSDREKLADVERDIASTREKISLQEVEVTKYIGGLTQAMSFATLETLRQTLSMLEQRRILLKYPMP